jgi:hypothetical protein
VNVVNKLLLVLVEDALLLPTLPLLPTVDNPRFGLNPELEVSIESLDGVSILILCLGVSVIYKYIKYV